MNLRIVYRLDDSVIMQIVRLIQLGFLTGTDVVDHFRQIVLEPSTERAGNLVLTPEYLEKEARDVQRLLDAAVEEVELLEKN